MDPRKERYNLFDSHIHTVFLKYPGYLRQVKCMHWFALHYDWVFTGLPSGKVCSGRWLRPDWQGNKRTGGSEGYCRLLPSGAAQKSQVLGETRWRNNNQAWGKGTHVVALVFICTCLCWEGCIILENSFFIKLTKFGWLWEGTIGRLLLLSVQVILGLWIS